MSNKKFYVPVLAAGIASIAGTAHADTVSTNLQVEATVTSNCTVSTSMVDFGDVDVTSGSSNDASGGVSITCTNGTPWSASAGLGSGTGATFAARRMAAGANLLEYNLFTNAGRTIVWGDGSAGTATVNNTGSGGAQNFTVYGRVASGQNLVPAGDYADLVQVTVTY